MCGLGWGWVVSFNVKRMVLNTSANNNDLNIQLNVWHCSNLELSNVSKNGSCDLD